MTELFGIPIGTLLVVLLAGLVAAALVIGLLALRNPVLVRLGVRNVGRRKGRSSLIVLGLMLGTAIFAAALTTGDTMSNTIRSTAVSALGETDELVSAKGSELDVGTGLGAATGVEYFDEAVVEEIDAALAGSDLVDGVTPAIVEQLAVQAPVQRRTEPRVSLFAADPERMDGFGTIEGSEGEVFLAELGTGEVFVNEKAAEELAVAPGDRVLLYAGGPPWRSIVRDVVSYKGAGTSGAALLMPLAEAQAFFGRPDQVRHVLVSNRGDATGGAALSDEVVERLTPVVAPHGLDIDPSKQDAVEAADEAGNAFMAFFTTFGSFSIAAGILLIFLVFVMLAAERRGELGIARAIGTRRGHLVQAFTFEGAAYDVAAALVGALLGAVLAFLMVVGMAQAFESVGGGDLEIQFAVSPRSLAIAYALGVLLTLAVVAFSAWRVSVMTISSAIRNLPEPATSRQRRRVLLALVGVAIGVLFVVSGTAGDSATPVMIGVSLVLASLVPILRAAGVPERAAFTACGLAIAVLLLLPWSVWETVFGPLAMDFSTWIAAGLMIVVGAVWVLVFNADLILEGAMLVLGRIRRLAPVLKVAIAYPLANRFRTGTTLAMFTLVVFTLVTGVASNSSFVQAFSETDTFGGGFDVRASSGAATPIRDVGAVLERTPDVRLADYEVAAGQSFLPADMAQEGTGRPLEGYVVRGLDAAFLRHTTFELGSMAEGYESADDVWRALSTRPGLAVVDSFVVPRRDSFGFGVPPTDFRLSGFFYEEGAFAPTPVTVRDPQSGREVTLTVIGILADTAPLEMAGISTSQATLSRAFPGRANPTVYYFDVAEGVDPRAAAAELESTFLAYGMEAESIEQVVEEATAASVTFNRLVQGFLGLGLIVGVAALGVISARSVVERRQQIGVLRALGFRRRMVQGAFLVESSFVALTSIAVGTGLGLLLAWNIVRDQQQQPSWANLELVVPWVNLAVIFVVVYAVAILATLAPARRASRIRPAEALRYE
ncbi:MAG TPA: FtsX-like permease family protein [Gaiellaceae bacterium]|nr:FtsX-like permease family protein [Gaiellaceae bacterium]